MAEEVLSDYRATGLTLRPHPMSLLRNQAPFNRCLRQVDLATLGNNRFVRIAGLVTCRQRPGTASGVLFLTLEDETGNSNIVVWKSTQAHFRQALMSAQLLLVTGTVETVDNVTHVVAGALQDYTHALQTLGRPAEGRPAEGRPAEGRPAEEASPGQDQASPDKAGLQLKSRDFH